RSLADAVRQRRRDAALRMLAPDFELRSAESLDAVAATDWLEQEMRAGAAPVLVRDLTVREFGDIAVVAFLLDSPGGSPSLPTLYVVDVWRQADRQLAVRYVSRPARPLPAPARPRGRG